MTNINLPLNVIKFAGDKVNIYEGVRDYCNHYMSETGEKKLGLYDNSVSLAEKEAKLNVQLLSEVERVCGMAKPSDVTFEQWATNPTIEWATFAVSNMVIDAILPDVIVKGLGTFMQLKNVAYGESAEFKIKPNSIMTVSEGSNARRTTFLQKNFPTSKTLYAVNHTITVGVSLFGVLSGKESLAEFIRNAIVAIEKEMTCDAYDALNTVVDAGTFPTALKKTGYTSDNLLALCEVVEAYNGSKPIILGTATALSKILPNSLDGYRIQTGVENMQIQLIRNFMGYDVMKLQQVATGTDFGVKLKNDRVYIISPNGDKIIKGVIEGSTVTRNIMSDEHADLSETATLNKRWDFEAITNSVMGCLKFA